MVAAGAFHTIAACENGKLLSWGGAVYGQLGHGNTENVLVPQLVDALKYNRVVIIGACNVHSAAVTKNGELWTWGSGSCGRLGHGETKDEFLPRVVKSLAGKRVVMVKAGGSHTAVVTEEGDLFMCGWGLFGALGHGGTEDRLFPQLVEAIAGKRVVTIAMGDRHTAVITEAAGVRELWTWGGCETGQLGHGGNVRELLPRVVESQEGRRLMLVSAGSFHTIAVTDEGVLMSTGYNGYGQLGHRSTENELKLRVVDELVPLLIQN